jgi:hypothetical protein
MDADVRSGDGGVREVGGGNKADLYCEAARVLLSILCGSIGECRP